MRHSKKWSKQIKQVKGIKWTEINRWRSFILFHGNEIALFAIVVDKLGRLELFLLRWVNMRSF
jgi:hypothetical protein